jgi:uncharacterized protein (TIGR02271 family)
MDEQQKEFLVIDRNGVRGLLDVPGTPDEVKQSGRILVRIENGTNVFVPSNQLVASQAGGYLLSHGFEEFGTAQSAVNEASVQRMSSGQQTSVTGTPKNLGEQLVVPILAEELHVEKESIISGGVRIHKRVNERTEVVDQPIQTEEVEVERIPINQMVDAPPAVRYEGDVIILPLVEEVIVTEKRLMLREEVRIRRRQFETRKPQEVTLRSEQVEFEEITPQDTARDSKADG